MAVNIPQCYPLHTFPSDFQRSVLNRLDQPDRDHLQETCKEEKAMVDRHAPVFLKNALLDEAPKVKEGVDRHLVTVGQIYGHSCQTGIEESSLDQEYDRVSDVFDLFKAKCSKLLPKIPSERKDSSGLFFEIQNQNPNPDLKITREVFDIFFEDNWKIRKDSYGLIDVWEARRKYNGSCIARLYNLKIMSEFVDKSLEAICKFPVG
jgi:hypothetical protein